MHYAIAPIVLVSALICLETVFFSNLLPIMFHQHKIVERKQKFDFYLKTKTDNFAFKASDTC